MDPTTAMIRVEELFKLFVEKGTENYSGEPVTQTEHGCQAAELARTQFPKDPELIIAALFHDIGHLLPGEQMQDLGRMDHDQAGGEFLKNLGFSERIATLVAGHVQAKRYRAFKDPEYYERLSKASKGTLEFQGGMMSAQEGLQFEHDPLFDLHFMMRGWDEAAKEANKPLPELGEFKELCVAHLRR